MSSTNSKGRLPPSEWDFSGLPNNEVNFAFYYEYARSSPAIRTLVSRQRRDELQAERITMETGMFPSPAIRSHHLWKVIQRLATSNDFPRRPWTELQATEFSELPNFTTLTPEKRREVVAFFHSPSPRPLMIMASNFTQEPTAPHEQTFVLRINWLANDRAIVESFEKNVCAARPQEFKECAIAPPPSQQSFDGSRLPFRKNSALMWLGVYRRRKAVAEWSNYVELYHPEESRFGLSTSIAHGDLIRARREDCRKAKLILGWFKDGTPLRKKDFK